MRDSLRNVLTTLLTAASLALALFAGPFLGALAGVLAGARGCAGGVLRGPGAWFAEELHRCIRDSVHSRTAAVLVAVPAGLVVGFVAGPLWLNFLGTPTVQWMGESLADRFLGPQPI